MRDTDRPPLRHCAMPIGLIECGRHQVTFDVLDDDWRDSLADCQTEGCRVAAYEGNGGDGIDAVDILYHPIRGFIGIKGLSSMPYEGC